MAAKVVEVKVPSEDIKAKLRGFSIARKAINTPINKEELGEYAPVVSLTMLTNGQLNTIKEAYQSKDDTATGAAVESAVRLSVKSITIYDVSTDEWETITGDTCVSKEDYDMLPPTLRASIITSVFQLYGLS